MVVSNLKVGPENQGRRRASHCTTLYGKADIQLWLTGWWWLVSNLIGRCPDSINCCIFLNTIPALWCGRSATRYTCALHSSSIHTLGNIIGGVEGNFTEVVALERKSRASLRSGRGSGKGAFWSREREQDHVLWPECTWTCGLLWTEHKPFRVKSWWGCGGLSWPVNSA